MAYASFEELLAAAETALRGLAVTPRGRDVAAYIAERLGQA